MLGAATVVDVRTLFLTGTGGLLIVAAAIGFYVYSRSRFTALFSLSLGLLFVGLQSILDGYINDILITSYGGSWDNVPQSDLGRLLALDTVRASFIVAWAGAEASVLIELLGVRDPRIRLGIPAGIWALGTFQSFAMNMLSGVEPVSQRIELSSIVRVYGFLVVIPLIVGFYIIDRMWRETGSRGLLYIGLAFLLHGVSVSLYSFLKGASPATLGIWYIVGGIVPSLVALYGMILLAREAAQAVAS
jgi:hypothetical protein